MVRVRLEIRKVGDLKVAVLLRGETGTGKELAARAIHAAGGRRDQPFVAVNMAALPPALAAAELSAPPAGPTPAPIAAAGVFSPRPTAARFFSTRSARRRRRFRRCCCAPSRPARSGPLGSEETRKVDVRLISATDADLEAGVAAERFRAPLLHRLAGFELRLPPLRDRRDDFGRLFLHFLCQELAAVGRPSASRARRRCHGCRPRWWPGWRPTTGRATCASC